MAQNITWNRHIVISFLRGVHTKAAGHPPRVVIRYTIRYADISRVPPFLLRCSSFIELISCIVSSIWWWRYIVAISVVLWYRDRVIQWYWYSFLHRCFHIDTLRYVSLLHNNFPCCHAIHCVLRNRRPPTPWPCQPPTMAAAPLTLARPSRQWFLRESWDHLEWQRWVLRVRVRVRVRVRGRGRSDIVYIYAIDIPWTSHWLIPMQLLTTRCHVLLA